MGIILFGIQALFGIFIGLILLSMAISILESLLP